MKYALLYKDSNEVEIRHAADIARIIGVDRESISRHLKKKEHYENNNYAVYNYTPLPKWKSKRRYNTFGEK